MTYEPSSVTPVQTAVGIIHDFMMGSIRVESLEDAIDTFLSNAQAWATNQLKDRGYNEVEIRCLFEDHEGHENLPIYDEYYKALTQFNRKVLTAAANSI